MIKLIFYYILIVFLISLSTIILHELGHFVFGLLINCKDIKVVIFDTKIMSSYTEMECPPNTNILLLGLSGSFLTLPVSLIYLFFFKNFEKYFGLIIFGFNLSLSSFDFQKYLNLPFADIFSIIGIIIVIYAEYLLIKDSV